MNTFDTILVPTDGSDHAVRAAEHAAALARAFDATLHVITVIDLRAAAGPFNAGGLREEVLDRIEADAGDMVDSLVDDVDVPDDVQRSVRKGTPVETIFDYADDHDVDMLAMGTHGRTGLDRYVLGSVTEAVVRRAAVPVLTARATEQSRDADAYDDVLVPTDGSEFATAAVDPALAVARRVDARVHALHVVNVGDAAASADTRPPAELMDQLEERGQRATEEIAVRARDAGLDAVTSVREGFPAADVLGYAEEADVDLVAMGTAGRTGLNRFLVGSTTERVIRHADVPVLAVNTREERAK